MHATAILVLLTHLTRGQTNTLSFTNSTGTVSAILSGGKGSATKTNYINTSVSIPQFCIKGATITAINISLDTTANPSYLIILTNKNVTEGFSATVTEIASLTAIYQLNPVQSSDTEGKGGSGTGPFTQTVDLSQLAPPYGNTFLSTNAFSAYVGTNQVAIPIQLEFIQIFSDDPAAASFSFTTTYDAVVSVSYDYVPFHISGFIYNNGLATITWPSEPGESFNIQSNASLDPANWLTISNVTANSTNSSATIPITGNSTGSYYRVALLDN